MGRLSPQTRRLIDAALAETPVEARRVPRGRSGLPGYVWRGGELVSLEPRRTSWHGLYARGTRRAPGGMAPAKAARIVAAIGGTQTYGEIGRRFGVSANTVQRLAAQHGVQRRARVDHAAVIRALQAGDSYAQISAQMDIGRVTVRRIAAAAGLAITVRSQPLTPEALTARIVALADGRRNLSAIARLAGCDRSTVRVRRDALGLDIPLGHSGQQGGGS